MKSFLLEDTLIRGILDHKLEPMMMEEDLSLSLKPSECSENRASDPEEPSDLLPGVVKNLAVNETELLNTLKDI